MQEEQDTCRICSAPAEPDQPLFYPCKCSGTIRYIHQDCLTTWLAHSKKKTCDVCKHPYSFTKVYAADMPSRLPVLLLVRRFAQQTCYALLFALRAVLIGLIWLAFLPWATIWTWRMYFTMGDSTAWWISNRPRPNVQSHVPEHLNVTTSSNFTSPDNVNVTYTAASFFAHPIVRAICSDIVAGQIIATVIVIAFVAVFLLREWISQNARPGVFDEVEPAPPAEEVPRGPEDLRARMEGLRARAEDLHARAEALRQIVRQGREQQNVQAERQRNERDAEAPPAQAVEATGIGALEARPAPPGLRHRRTAKERFYAELSEGEFSSSASYKKRRHSWNGQDGLKVEDDDSELAHGHSDDVSTGNDELQGNSSESSPLEGEPSTSTSSSKGKAPQKVGTRPPLFSTALFPADGSSSGLSSPADGNGAPPLASPSLTTYHPPEELQAGPSSSSGYFRGYVNDDDEEYEEYNLYFRQGENAPGHNLPADDDAETVNAHDEHEEKMPALENWTDDEFDEPEDDENIVHEIEVPADANPENGEMFDDNRERAPDDMQAADAMNEDDIDAGMDDDMEGALEGPQLAIGLRGPIQTVLQNAALMIFVLDTTIGVGVWLPFTVGKSLALLSLDPRRLLYVLHFPLRVIRVVTDPIVDSFMFLLARLAVPPLLHFAQLCLETFVRMLAATIGQEGATRGVQLTTNLYYRTIEVSQEFVKYSTALLASQGNVAATPSPSLLEKLASEDSVVVQMLVPYFAPLGETVRALSTDVQEAWVKLAVGDGTLEKVFAISLGYAVDILLLALYLNVLTVGSMKNAGRAVRGAIRQQLVVVKVASFIIIELIVFPLGCGVMLDICSVSLFPQGSLRTRTEFLLYAPLTAAFYHWVIGTMFMYQFAILLAGFRSCLRTGALWFIKDPQDQNFHPIRDILERPTLVHIRKLLLSAVMYGLVVACGVATVSGMLRVFSKTIMPFRWKVRDPLSVVPIDLIFLHLVLPYTMQYFRPKKVVKQGGLHVWKFLAHQLRLSSYLFGGRHAEEEYSLKRISLDTIFGKPTDLDITHDGGFRRVPNSDNVALPKDEPSTVEVDELGTALNDKEARLLRLQNAEAEKTKRNVKDDYTIVYIPPYFRYRVFAFIFGLWMVCSIVLSACLAIPVLLGRYFFRLFTPEHVHDGYSFLAGFYLLWGCWIIGTSIDRMDKHRQRRGGSAENRGDFALYFVKRSSLWLAKVTYLAFFLGIVIPTLIATVVELYLVMPVRQTLQPELPARIRLVDMWALGLMYTKIALRAQRFRPMGRISRSIEQLRRHGWTHPHPWTATKEVIVPIVAGLLGMIVLPPIALWAVQRIFHLQADQSLLFLHVYPSIFTFAACAQGAIALATIVRSWSQAVRDKEFLVEMRLQNLEPEFKPPEANAAEGEDATVMDEEDEE